MGKTTLALGQGFNALYLDLESEQDRYRIAPDIEAISLAELAAEVFAA